MSLIDIIWKDSVWSKVIATAITFIASLLIKKVRVFFLDLFRRIFPKKITTPNKSPVVKTKSTKIDDLEEWVFGDTTDFFERRFASAFPGLRKPTWFYRKEAVSRLLTLLRDPLVFKSGKSSWIKPIWWWSDGNSDITKCKKIGKTKLLMDCYELDIDKICAVYHRSSERMFVYVQTKAMKPTGLYGKQIPNIEEYDDLLFHREEYGLYKKKLMTRQEFDDGATVINRKLVNTMSIAELRVRFITPFIFLIAPNESIVNNNDFDEVLEDYIRNLLISKATPEQLVDHIFNLEKDLHQIMREIYKKPNM
jgi:hypothetical protein